MHLEDIPTLRTYLTGRLETLYKHSAYSHLVRSDADPAALADYIIALLKHEKPPAELKSFCASQLSDFLHSNTGQFVETLFRRIEGRPEPVEDVVMTAPAPALASESETRRPAREDNRMRDSKSYSDEEDRDRRPRHRQERNRSRSRSRNRMDDRRSYPRREYHQQSQRGNHGRVPPYGMVPPGMMDAGHRGIRPQRRYQNPPPQNRSDTRLVIDRIPPEYCSISMVNDYFQRFGTIVNITVQPEMQRARIEFSSHEEANNAYTSPDVIFENRFVKVYWDHEDLPTASVVRPAVTTPRPGNPAAARNEAFQKKQEALKGMLELQKQKQELLLKYISQQKELLAKLESKALPEGEKQEILKTLKGIDDLIKSLNLSSISSEESSSLKKSTDMIIDTPEQGSSTPESSQPVTPILRGGPLMRGRGGGMVRGRGGAFASREAHRLDLRPTAFLMKPVPSRVGRDIGSIRKLYEPYGEIKNITLCDDQSGVIVSFSKRADAEKAYFYMPKADLGEPFELEWIASALSQSSPALSSISVPGDVSLGITDTSAMPEHIAFEEEGADDSHWKR